MGTYKRKKKKPTIGNETSSKMKLLKALEPLCHDIPWMNDIITKLQKSNFPDNNNEMLKLAIHISGELSQARPELFKKNNLKTSALKDFIHNTHKELEKQDEMYEKENHERTNKRIK